MAPLGFHIRTGAVRHCGTSTKQRRRSVILNQIKCPQRHRMPLFLTLLSVGQGVDAGAAKGRPRMGTRQHGRGKVRCRRHDVRSDEGVFHHLLMQRLIVAASPPIAHR